MEDMTKKKEGEFERWKKRRLVFNRREKAKRIHHTHNHIDLTDS